LTIGLPGALYAIVLATVLSIVQAFGSYFLLLDARNFSHRGWNKIPARTRIPRILIMGELRISGLAHKKVVSPARTKRLICKPRFRGLKKYPLKAPAKNIIAIKTIRKTVIISRGVPFISKAWLNTKT
jgi:hypothetical protein